MTGNENGALKPAGLTARRWPQFRCVSCTLVCAAMLSPTQERPPTVSGAPERTPSSLVP